MDRLLLNGLPIRTGGGLQKSLTFLSVLPTILNADGVTLWTRSGGPLVRAALDSRIAVTECDDSLWGRFWQELNCRGEFPPETLCFTLSGPIMLGSIGYFVNVTECAYSNLFYPEVDFRRWGSIVQRTQERLVDLYRKVFVAAADFWIFQTEAIRNRAVERFGFPEERSRVVRVAPGSNISLSQVSKQIRRGYMDQMTSGPRLLFLNGPEPNKRLHQLPALVQALKDQGLTDVCVVVTLPEADPYTKQVRNSFENSALKNHLVNVGPVPPEELSSCIDAVDGLVRLSVLESFSNNFIEAWAMKRPLFVTDADWAREACGDGACYLDIERPEQSARSIVAVLSDPCLHSRIIKEGRKILKTYSTPEVKAARYLEALEDARRLGKCELRQKVRILKRLLLLRNAASTV